MSRLREKLIVGTASFGGPYGVANTSQMADSEVAQLTKLALAAEVIGFDSAINYGSAQVALANQGVGSSMVYSKIEEVSEDSGELIKVVGQIVKDFGGGRLRGLTVHRPERLVENSAAKRRAIADLRETGMVESLGVSVYEPETVPLLSRMYEFDYVQAPVNVFDQRFIQPSVSEFFERKGLWLQGRSIFLQGALLSPQLWNNRTFGPYIDQFQQVQDCAEAKGLTMFGLALGFGMSLPQVKELVIGVNHIRHLEQLLDFEILEDFDNSELFSLASEQLELIDPRRWQL